MTDLLILGNGIAGMTAALYAQRANLNFKLIGKDEYDFGQIGNAVSINNFPCISGLSGFELAEKLHDQLIANDIEIEEHEIVDITDYVEKSTNNPYWLLHTADGTTEKAKAIIYALGAQHRKLSCAIDNTVPIHYCAICDGPLYKDKRVAIIGGGDVAFTQAEYLSKICKDVYIVMCDQNVTAAPATFDRVSKLRNVHIWCDAPVLSISKDSEEVCWIMCEGVRGPLFAEGIFVAIGMEPNTQMLSNWRFNNILDVNKNIIADENGRTAIDGFFAAGDVRQKQLRQAITAAADGANAVSSVIAYLKLIKAAQNF